jgi:hypothetical protein
MRTRSVYIGLRIVISILLFTVTMLAQENIVKSVSLRDIPLNEKKYIPYNRELTISFTREVAFDSVSNIAYFRIYDVLHPLSIINLERVSNPIGDKEVEFMIIYGNFDYDSLALEVNSPNFPKQTIAVSMKSTLLSDASLLMKIVRYIRKETAVDLDVRQIVQTKTGLAADYGLETGIMTLPQIFGERSSTSLSFATSGKLGADTTNTPNTMDGQILASSISNFDFNADERVYYGLRLGVGFVTAQNHFADSLLGTAKIQGVISVPLISQLVLWWNKTIDYSENFLPPIIYAGYTQDFGKNNKGRFDVEIKANLPLGSGMHFIGNYNASYTDAKWKTYYEVSTGISTTKVSSLILKYVEGHFPPFFQTVKNYGLGFAFIL